MQKADLNSFKHFLAEPEPHLLWLLRLPFHSKLKGIPPIVFYNPKKLNTKTSSSLFSLIIFYGKHPHKVMSATDVPFLYENGPKAVMGVKC